MSASEYEPLEQVQRTSAPSPASDGSPNSSRSPRWRAATRKVSLINRVRESPRERRQRQLAQDLSPGDLARVSEADSAQVQPPWMEMIFVVLFMASLWNFQCQHVDILVQQDVHGGLRDDLDLHVDGDDNFHNVRTRSDMFAWLSTKLLPSLSKPGAAFTPDVSTATRNRTQCLAVLGGTSRAHECDLCDNTRPPVSSSSLKTYIDEYTLVYEGLRIRQSLHCELTGIDAHGQLHHLQYQSASRLAELCQHNRNMMFVEAARDMDFAESTGGYADDLPPAGCYDFDAEMRAARALARSPEEREWLEKCTLTRSEMFIPVRAGQAAVLAAGQTLLNVTANSDWTDPATAAVEASFLAMNIEYGMLSEVVLSFQFKLGGSVETRHTIRSVPAAIFDTRDVWHKWEPWMDTLFVAIMVCRWVLELRVMRDSCAFAASDRRQELESKRGKLERTNQRKRFREKRRRVASSSYTSFCPARLNLAARCRAGGAKETSIPRSCLTIDTHEAHMVVFDEWIDDNSPANGKKKTTIDMKALKEVMEKLRMDSKIEIIDSYLEAAMDEHDGEMTRREFNTFYRKYSRLFSRAYCTDAGKLMLTLPLLSLHTYACMLLYQSNSVTAQFVELAHDGNGSTWGFSSAIWHRTPAADEIDDAVDQMHHVVDVGHQLRSVCGVMVILQALVCQRYCIYINHKLAIVAESIRGAFDELKHFFIVFAVMLFMYAFAGYFLYGAELPEYANRPTPVRGLVFACTGSSPC